jgi:tetratricopeptide (TPR) repeat protein
MENVLTWILQCFDILIIDCHLPNLKISQFAISIFITTILLVNAQQVKAAYVPGVDCFDPQECSTTLAKIAVSKFKAGNYTGSLYYLDKALWIQPNHPTMLNNKGFTLFTLGNYSGALYYIDKALVANASNAGYWHTKGLILNKLGNHEEAIKSFDKALEINPNYVDVLGEKGLTLNIIGNYSGALHYSNKALAIDPEDVNVTNNKGFSLDGLGRHKEAIEYYDKVLAIDPNDVVTLRNKAVAFYELGDYTGALKYLDKALAIDPHNAIALKNKEIVLEALNKNVISQHATAAECNVHCQFEVKYSQGIGTTKDENDKYAFAEIDTDSGWSGAVMGTDSTSATKEGSGTSTIPFPCSSGGIYSLVIQKQGEFGTLHIKVVKKGGILKEQTTSAAYGVISLSGTC